MCRMPLKCPTFPWVLMCPTWILLWCMVSFIPLLICVLANFICINAMYELGVKSECMDFILPTSTQTYLHLGGKTYYFE